MKIVSIELYQLKIPFKMNFVHSMAERSHSDSIILKISNGKNDGYGEAIIREYVGGNIGTDNLESASKILLKKSEPILSKDITWEDAQKYFSEITVPSEELPLLCALETAVMDLFCWNDNIDIYQLLQKDPLRENIKYEGLLPIIPLNAAQKYFDLFKKMAIESVRIKIGKDKQYNQDILKLARDNLGIDFDIRVDINGVWTFDDALINLPIFNENGISIIEEPFAKNSNDLMKIFNEGHEIGFSFMADESFLTENDLTKIIEKKYFSMLNLRLSKNGGLLKTLKLAEKAESSNIKYQLGCHVGETGILSALGRVAASFLKDPIYIDGSFDSYLLKENITTHNFDFGYKGEAQIIRGNSIGFNIDNNKLNKLSLKNIKIL